MKFINNKNKKEGMDGAKKSVLIWSLVLVFLSLSTYAQFIQTDALSNSLSEQILGIKKWYAITGYETDANGKQTPIYDPQYLAIRTIIDFVAVTLLVWLALNKTKIKEWHKGAPGFIALIIGFSFAFLSGYGLLTTIASATKYILFFLAVFAVDMVLSALLVKDEKNAAGRIGVFILAIVLVALIFFFANKTGFMNSINLGFGTGSSAGKDIPPANIISGTLGGGTAATSDNPLKQSRELLTQAQGELNKAEHEFSLGNYDNAAKYYKSAEALAKQANDIYLQIP